MVTNKKYNNKTWLSYLPVTNAKSKYLPTLTFSSQSESIFILFNHQNVQLFKPLMQL